MDVGFVFLFDEDRFNPVYKRLPYHKRLKNRIHLSLYQFAICPSKAESLWKAITVLQIPSLRMSFHNSLSWVGKNLFWRCRVIPGILAFHQRVIENVQPFRKGFLTQVKENYKSFTRGERELIHRYGVPWGIPENFDPHVTLLYNHEDRFPLEGLSLQPIACKPRAFALVRLGFHGTVEAILFEYCLALTSLDHKPLTINQMTFD